MLLRLVPWHFLVNFLWQLFVKWFDMFWTILQCHVSRRIIHGACGICVLPALVATEKQSLSRSIAGKWLESFSIPVRLHPWSCLKSQALLKGRRANILGAPRNPTKTPGSILPWAILSFSFLEGSENLETVAGRMALHVVVLVLVVLVVVIVCYLS